MAISLSIPICSLPSFKNKNYLNNQLFFLAPSCFSSLNNYSLTKCKLVLLTLSLHHPFALWSSLTWLQACHHTEIALLHFLTRGNKHFWFSSYTTCPADSSAILAVLALLFTTSLSLSLHLHCLLLFCALTGFYFSPLLLKCVFFPNLFTFGDSSPYQVFTSISLFWARISNCFLNSSTWVSHRHCKPSMSRIKHAHLCFCAHLSLPHKNSSLSCILYISYS